MGNAIKRGGGKAKKMARPIGFVVETVVVKRKLRHPASEGLLRKSVKTVGPPLEVFIHLPNDAAIRVLRSVLKNNDELTRKLVAKALVLLESNPNAEAQLHVHR